MTVLKTGTQRDTLRFIEDHPEGVHVEYVPNAPRRKFKYCTAVEYNAEVFGVGPGAESPDIREDWADNYCHMVYRFIRQHPGCYTYQINADPGIRKAHLETGNQEVKDTTNRRLLVLQKHKAIRCEGRGSRRRWWVI